MKKIERMTKQEIISKIIFYDSRFSKYSDRLQDLQKSVLINILAIVLLDYVSSSLVSVTCSKFNNFLKELK